MFNNEYDLMNQKFQIGQQRLDTHHGAVMMFVVGRVAAKVEATSGRQKSLSALHLGGHLIMTEGARQFRIAVEPPPSIASA
jgi:hypothetical protein